jgi:Peptidase family M13
MSSPSQEASQGPSTPAEQPSGEQPSGEQPSGKQPKRPSSLGRHTSSWVNRFHRHHDRKHHRSENDAERPLLANDHLDEEDEEAQNESAPPSTPAHGLRRFVSATNHHTKKAYNTSRNVLARNAKHILIACLLALLTLLVSICLGFFFHHKNQKKLSTCQSAACVHAASEILYNLDPNHAQLDACTQFDRMICGGWEQRHDLRPDQGDMFTGTIMAENSKTILRHILEQSSSTSLSSPADRHNFQKLKDDYDSCMNEQKLQKIGLKPLQGIVNQIKMSFPTATDRTGLSASSTIETRAQKGAIFEETSQLTNTMLFMMKHDIRPFMTFDVGVRTASLPFQTTIFPFPIV